MKRGRKIVG